MWCKTQPDAAWKNVLKSGLVSLSRHTSIVPIALSNDGRSFFAEIYTKTYSGVVRIDASNSRYTEIKRFPDPVNDQASGNFDGRWLVWAEFHSLYDQGDFTVWSWDSRTGRLGKIGSATRSPSGKFWPGSSQAPVALAGYATWEQGSGANGLGEVHVVDLANGQDRVVRHGHPGGSFLIDGPLVVWPESMKPNTLTVMRAANARTGRAVATPQALRNLHGGLAPVTDGRELAYATNDLASLWWASSLAASPRRVYTAPNDGFLGVPLAASGRYASFSVAPVLYIADAVLGRYIEINQGGWARVGATAIVLLKPSAKKALHGISDVIFLPLKSLPLIPPCR